ncbi:MAG: shikimate kinase [Acholeplasmataceae bacterium]|jgi:shikimate kinase
MRIYLIGLPGVGKTTIGKMIAEKLNFNFYDTDDLIFKTVGEMPKDIINNKGEAYFREIETAILKSTLNLPKGIISCGGGIVEKQENQEFIKGLIVYLKADPHQLSFSDNEIKSRPLLEASGIVDLYEKRKNKYLDFSNLVIDVTNKSNEMVADEVIKSYENFNN